MKREYRKPMVVFENFAMSTNIAGTCEVKTWTPAQMTCPYTPPRFPDLSIFIDSSNGCTTAEADGEYDGICYFVPSESNTLFNS